MLCFFGGNAFVDVVAVAVVVNFQCVDFVALAAGIDVAAVLALFVDFVPVVTEIVIVVYDADLRQVGHFLLRTKNQTLSIEFL